MPKMTLAQHKTLAKLQTRLDDASHAIYAAVAPRNDVRFNDCFAIASEQVKQAYLDAANARDRFQDTMVNEGRAWRATFGMFTPNWR